MKFELNLFFKKKSAPNRKDEFPGTTIQTDMKLFAKKPHTSFTSQFA